jgi:phosphatidate cytidylyltransferase
MAVGELTQRIITAAVIVPLFALALFVGEDVWTLLMVILGMLMTLEWQKLSQNMSLAVKIGGIPYMALAIASAIMLRTEPFGLEQMLFVVVCVVATDTAAYFGGKRLGRHKLAPSISPNKTWEGLGCGVVGAAFVGAVAAGLEGYPYDAWSGALLGAALALVSQAGDLLESAVKRKAGVKDSGNLLPGHGGLLDRMDGYLTALPFFYAWVLWDSFYGLHSSGAV